MAETRSGEQRTIIVAALITAVATIGAAIVSAAWGEQRARAELMPTIEAMRESTVVADVIVRAADYPFPVTNIFVEQGDTIEILVLSEETSIVDCGLGRTTAVGLVQHELQAVTVLPSANICSLIGQIGNSPAFAIGAYGEVTAVASGELLLGINDVLPEYCSIDPPEMCYRDNLGELVVRVARPD